MNGRQAYEDDVRRNPFYPDGTTRKKWDDIGPAAQWSWNKRKPIYHAPK